MKRVLIFGVLISALVAALPLASAQAVVHETVAAYCSGGGHGAIDENGFLEPPGLSDQDKKNFARPVIANGTVEGEFPNILITDKPAAKFEAGTNAVFDLNSETVDHPSAEHCPKNALP